MSTTTAATTRASIAQLYRRAGFGASGAELDAGEAAGFSATLESLLAGLQAPDVPPLAPPAMSTFLEVARGRGGNLWEEENALIGWWLEKMAGTSTPLREKLTLLLHGQFPTGFSKVGLPRFMYEQNELFRSLGPGAFDTLTKAVAKGGAMLIWLDTGTDQRQDPNENFARELMERFTMGIGNYSQSDVRESARAFTGWGLTWPGGVYTVNAWAHDYGEKVFLGYRGDLSGEDVIEIVTHTPASARWVISRMWSWLAYPVGPTHPVVAELAPGYAADLNMSKLLGAILAHPEFTSPSAGRGLVKQPIEWVAGILRAFRLRSAAFHKFGGANYLQGVLSGLGQIPFDPPTVGGWGTNAYWLSTASSLAQLNFAQSVAEVADLSPVHDEAVGQRVDALANLLGIETWTPQSRAALTRVRHLTPQLVALGLTAPEYVAN